MDAQHDAALAALEVIRWVPFTRSEHSPDERLQTIARKESGPLVLPSPLSPGVAPIAHLGWEALRERVATCMACDLCHSRTQTVFGKGNAEARLLIVGEAPGAEEDRQGEPFVGPAGQLLDEMLRAIGLGHEHVYICNILKCRPPRNADPTPAQAMACRPFLTRQIALINPQLILAVGRIAAQNLLQVTTPLSLLRGQIHYLETAGQESARPVWVTYHPAYLLRSPREKARAWDDLKMVRTWLERSSS